MICGLLLWFNLGFGLQQEIVNVNGSAYNKAPIYTSLELHAENDYIDIYGSYKNEMFKDNGSLYFNPVQDYFIVGTKLKYKNISLKIEHECIHPVLSNSNCANFYGGYNRIEFNINSKDK